MTKISSSLDLQKYIKVVLDSLPPEDFTEIDWFTESQLLCNHNIALTCSSCEKSSDSTVCSDSKLNPFLSEDMTISEFNGDYIKVK